MLKYFFELIWIFCVVIFFIMEINGKEIFFIYFSFASALSLITSVFTINIEIQVVVFIISSLVMVIFFKTVVDKIIEKNLKFKRYEFMDDKFCIVIKEANRELFLYKVLTKSGIYMAKYIAKEGCPQKFKICMVVHDDGGVILIRWKGYIKHISFLYVIVWVLI